MRYENISRRIFMTGAAATMTIAAISAWSAGQPASSVAFTPDKGKLTIQLDGKTIGSEQFEFAPSGSDWIAKGTTDLTVPGSPATRVSGTLKLQPDGAPISYEWTSHADKTNGAHIVFANGVAKITLEMQGARPFEQDLTFNAPLIAILDNNLYHQYALLARMYDWSKRGTQTGIHFCGSLGILDGGRKVVRGSARDHFRSGSVATARFQPSADAAGSTQRQSFGHPPIIIRQ
jgi:hypothetical protein